MKFTVPARFTVGICKNHKAWEGFRNGRKALSRQRTGQKIWC